MLRVVVSTVAAIAPGASYARRKVQYNTVHSWVPWLLPKLHVINAAEHSAGTYYRLAVKVSS